MSTVSPALTTLSGSDGPAARLKGSMQRQPFGYAVAAIVTVGTLLRLPHFIIPIWAERTDFHPFRQTQTLTMVREIMRNGVDFSSVLPVFGPPWVLPMEFPTYQNLAALIGLALGIDEVAASRLTTLVAFQASAVILVVLTRRLAGRTAALAALIVWEFTQLLWSWSVAPTIEFLAVLFALLGAYTSLTMVRRLGSQLLPVLTTGIWILAFLTKFTTALVWMPFLLGMVWFAVGGVRGHILIWLRVLIPVAIGGLVGVLFVLHSDAVKASSPFTEFLTSENLSTWNFGTLDQRLAFQSWGQVLVYANGIVGSSVLFLILAVILVLRGPRKQAVLVAAGLVSVVSAVAVFFNLYYVHNYYLIAVAPIMCLIVGMLGAQLTRVLEVRMSPTRVYAILTLGLVIIIVMSWTLSEGRQALEKFVYQEWRYGQSAEIAEATMPTDGIAVVGCSWSPEILYFADRRGLMLHNSWAPGNLQHTIPEEWVGSTISYVFLCTNEYQIEPLFEVPVVVEQVSSRLYRVGLTTD